MKFTLNLCLLFILSTAYGQVETSKEFSYTMSNPYTVVDGTKWYFNTNENEVVSLKKVRSGFIFQKFEGDKLNEIKRTELDELPDGSQIESIVQVADKIYLFYSLWDRAATTEQLFARELNYETGKFLSDKLLVKVKGKVSGVIYGGMFFNYSVGDKFDISTDFNETKLLVQYRLRPENKNDAENKDKIGFHTFTKDLEVIWGDVITMPYTERKMNNEGYCLDNDANVYLIAEIFKNETTKRTTKEGDPNYDIHLIRIDSETQELVETKIELKDKFLTNYGFFEGANNEIIIAGYYSNDKYFKTNGLYSYRLSSDGEIISSTSNEFDAEVLKQFESERTKNSIDKAEEKGRLGISNLRLRHLVYNTDGSITTIGEVYYVESRYNAQTNTTTYTYHYEEMIACNVAPEGEMNWMVKLPKNQTSGSSINGLGYYLVSGEKHLYLVFLDNVKNLNLEENKIPARHSDGAGGYLTAYQVDNQAGTVKKLSIFDTREVNGIPVYQFMTRRIVELSDDEFAIEFYKKQKEDVMIRVKVDAE